MTRPPLGIGVNRVKFENPPINELIIGLFHLPIMDMKAQHIGIYWNHIRDRYPRCEQHPIIVSNPSDSKLFQEVSGEIFPLQRFWFFQDNHPMLIQIQRNAFLFNWRRGAANEYPHYETVIKDFWQEFEGYKTFVQEWEWEGLDVIQRYELNYINVIPTNEIFANPAQLVNMLPSIASLSNIRNDDRRMIGLNTTATYQVNETLRIDMAVRLGRRTDTNELIAILDLKAHGVPSDLSFDGARAWYDSAHDAIYKMFLDVTSREAQEKIWKRL